MVALLLAAGLLAAAGMMLQADIRDWNRRFYQDLSRVGRFATTDTTATSWLTCPGLRYTIYIQKITINVVTDAAQNLTLRDSAGTPKVIIVMANSPGVGVRTYDFGPDGIPLTEGKNLDAVLSAAGLAFDLIIEAYAKPTSTRSMSEI